MLELLEENEENDNEKVVDSIQDENNNKINQSIVLVIYNAM